ncbi:DUF6265 family protein [Geojedonia litorea]|uniref:DUF6265 family protein n=1 Tax=Geojedonia litorea TaxID=1268269 RepID=A0ABV9N0B4_9FLAO
MKKHLLLICYLLPLFLFAQPDTEVFLFDLTQDNQTIKLSNFKNISNNEGYDNQPSFLDNNTLFYAATRNGQTDILEYQLNNHSKRWVNSSEGSEYSPLKIPNQNALSAIRLDKNGTQTLQKYNLKTGESEILVDDIVIGYHVWFNKNLLLSSVLENNGLSLYSTTFPDHKNHRIQEKVGRSLHNIPNTNLVSYISKDNDSVWDIKSVDPTTGTTASIINTLPQSEDLCWLNDGTILMAYDGELYQFNPKLHTNWVKAFSFSDVGIKNITRLAVSPNGKKLAVVGELADLKLEPKLENIAWIAGNWKGEAFGGQVEENWSQPSGGSMMATFKLINNGKVSFYEIEIIREVDNTLVLQLKHFNNDLKGWEEKDKTIDFPLKEITSNKVIFEGMTFEKVNANEMNVYVDLHQKDGTIKTEKINYKKETTKAQTTMPSLENPEAIVQKQLDAYNARDIDAFMATYTDDIILIYFPDTIRSLGSVTMRKNYTEMFNNTPDLFCEIKKRIVIGNKVIDHEYVLKNGEYINAVAIYEVENGLIKKVTFIK